jgi:flagellar protein FlaJ
MSFSDLLVKARIKPGRYVSRVLLPLICLAIGSAAIIYVLEPLTERISYFYPLRSFLETMGYWFYLLYIFPLLILVYAILYPKISADRRRAEIDNNMHYYITHWGVLSRAEIKMKDLLKELSERKEYKALAEETGYVHSLQDKWSKTFPDACRFARRRTPSKILSDFLGRFAHAIDSGEDVREFLNSEQEAVMTDFSNTYERKLYSIDVFKEIYISIVVAIMFMGVFSIIAPFIGGMSPFVIFSSVFVLFIFTEMLLVYYLKILCPVDPIWQISGVVTRRERKRTNYFILSFSLCIIVLIANLVLIHQGIFPIPSHYKYHFIIATSIAPLLIVGFKTKSEEDLIKRKDNLIPTFLRSIGAAAGAAGGKITGTVGYLTVHDFDPLTPEIVQFHRRLSMRIDEEKSWTLFTTSTSSNLIYRFCGIFRGGIALGVNPAEVGNFVATNMDKTLNLRKKRYATVATLVGILYGLMAAIGVCLFITFGIAGYINETWSELSAATEITSERVELLERHFPEIFEHHLLELSSTLSALPLGKLSELLAEYFPASYSEHLSSILATIPPEGLTPYLTELSRTLRGLPPERLEVALETREAREVTPERLAELPGERLTELIRTYNPGLLGGLSEEFAPERIAEFTKEFAPESLAGLTTTRLAELFAKLPHEKRLALITDMEKAEEERIRELGRHIAELEEAGKIEEAERIGGEIEAIRELERARAEIGGILFPIAPTEVELTLFILLLMIVVFAIMSALALTIGEGGHLFGSLKHFVFLVWVGVAAGIVAEELISLLLVPI